MASRQPRDPEALKKALPNDYSTCITRAREYGAFLFIAERQGDEYLVSDIEQVLIHLRYRCVQLCPDTPSNDDLIFVRIYEASYMQMCISPLYAATQVNLTDALSSYIEDEEKVAAEKEAAIEALVGAVEVRDIKVTPTPSCDSDSECDEYECECESDYDSDCSSDSDYFDAEDLDGYALPTDELGQFENSDVEEFIYAKVLDDVYSEATGIKFEPEVQQVLNIAADETVYQVHHNTASSKRNGKLLRQVRYATDLCVRPESCELSLLEAVSQAGFSTIGKILCTNRIKLKGASSLWDLSMRAYVRGKLVIA